MKHAGTVLMGIAALVCAVPGVAWGTMNCPDDTTKQCDCVHPPITVPALSGAPEWFDMDGDGFYRPQLNDPRWSGAPLQLLTYSDQVTVTDAAQTRIVQQGNYLYVSYQALTDDQGPNGSDFVYLGITAGSGSQAYGVRIAAVGTGTSVAVPASAPADTPAPEPLAATSAKYWASNSSGSFTGATVVNSLPSWIDKVAVFKPNSGQSPWAVTLRIDKSSSGLNASAGSIRIFLGIGIHFSATTAGAVVPFANVNPVTGTTSVGAGSTIIPPDPTTWPRYAEPGTTCSSGVTLVSSDVGVYPGTAGTTPSGTLTNEICAQSPCPSGMPTGSQPANVFRVIARKVPSGGGIGSWDLRMRLRIADWGSTVANRKYGPWTDISTTPTGPSLLTGDVVSQLTTTNGWHFQAIDDGSGTTDNVVMDYQCTPTGTGTSAFCPHLADPTATHQCMLVELGEKDPLFDIATNAVYRNMDFYPLSSIDVPAKLTIQGLKEATGLDGERDVYLYVEKRNMPAHGEKPLWLPAEAMKMALALAQNPPTIPQPPPPKDKRTLAMRKKMSKEALALQDRRMAEATARAGRIAASTQTIGNVPISSTFAMSPDQILDAVWPTYRIRVFYDTGRTFNDGAGASPVLAPMVPFGYRLSHDGPFYGFTDSLESADPGVTLQKLNDSWYKVRFKNEATPIHIRTKITAEERPSTEKVCPAPVPCPTCGKCPECKVTPGTCGCRLGVAGNGARTPAMLLGLGLGLALIARRRASRRARTGSN